VQWKLAAHGSAPENTGAPDRFAVKRFGSKSRLVWPNGACGVTGLVASWGRFAAIIEQDAIVVIDGDRKDVARVELPGFPIVPDGARTANGTLWLTSARGALAIPLADLEELAEPRTAEITIATWHPHRNAFARVPAKVVWVVGDECLINLQGPPVVQVRLDHAKFGLEKGMEIAFVDELWPGRFAYLDVPGRPRQTLSAPAPLVKLVATSARVEPIDPAEGATAIIARRGEYVPLIAELAANPDDELARGVLLDALADAGEPCAATFALLRADKKVSAHHRRAALGPLAHFLHLVKFQRGLPWSGTLIEDPPLDADAVAAFLGDLRVAMLETIRIGKGPETLYRELVASRELVCLRRVDAVDHLVLGDLRDAHAGRLRQLFGVPWTNGLAMSLLVDPAFDSVGEVELVAEATHPRGRLSNLVDGLGALSHVPRRVTFATRTINEARPIAQIVFPVFLDLGLEALVFPEVTIERVDGRAVVHDTAGPNGIADLARAAFPSAS